MKLRHILLITGLVFCLDQLSKWYVLDILNLNQVGTIAIIPGYINFIMAWNKGINFGLFASDSMATLVILTSFAVLVSLGLIWWNIKTPGRLLGIGSGLIIGGALANAFDRIIHGAVADFLNVTAFGIHNPFSFNIADISIFIGAVVVIIDIQFDAGKELAEKK